MSDKQKHLDFLKDLKVLMEKHGVDEIYPTNDYDVVFQFNGPVKVLEIKTTLDLADFDKHIARLEREIQDDD